MNSFVDVMFYHPEAQILLLGLQKDKSTDSKYLMRRVFFNSLRSRIYSFQMTEDDLWYLAYLIPLDQACGEVWGSDVLLKLLGYIQTFHEDDAKFEELIKLMEDTNASRNTSESTREITAEDNTGQEHAED